jgi:hypothetical protein
MLTSLEHDLNLDDIVDMKVKKVGLKETFKTLTF